jgi:hypothetical protein
MVAAPRSNASPRLFALAVFGLSALLAVPGATPGFAQNQAPDQAPEPQIPQFREVAGKSGLQHVFDSDAEFSVGGGAAGFDCDGDKDTDLFLAGGNGSAGLFRNMVAPGKPLRFENISKNLGLSAPDYRRVSGGYPLDYDNDGDLDLFVMRFGNNRLLKNDGACNFTPADDAGFPEMDERTTAFAAAWLKNQPFPALFIGNHVNPAQEPGTTGQCAASYVHLPPDAEAPDYGGIRPLTPSFCPLSYLLVDWSGHGRFDLRAANDMAAYGEEGAEQLYHLTNGIAAYSESEGWSGDRIVGAGLASRDIDGNGRPEIVVADRAGSRFYVLEGEIDEPRFTDQSLDRGLTLDGAEYEGPVPVFSWHVEFGDFNNDALSDLLIVRGQRQTPPQASPQDHDMLLLGLPDGTFRNAAREAGVALPTVGRGAAIADFDRDGCQDIIVVNRNAPVSLFRNLHCEGEGRPGWLDVELEQAGINTDAIGASVILRAGERVQTQAVTIGGGHAGGLAGPLHYGLGESAEAVLRVRWPDGSITDPITIPANRSAIIKRSGQTITVNMGE